MEEKKISNFTQGRILGPLLGFAVPVLFAMFLQTMYGAVDLLIVGQYADTADVSAVATGSQLMHTVTTVLVGLAMGITVLLAQKIGEGKPRVAGCVIGSGVTLFAAMAAVMTLLLVMLTEPLCRLLHAPENAFSQTVDYVRICSGGTAFIIAFNVLGSVFRGIGDSKMPLITVAIACAANIAGDWLLVAVFGMGAAGAAWATVLAQGLSVVLSLLIIARRRLPFEFHRSDLRPDRALAGHILRIGTPIALQDLLVSVSFLVITAIVNSLGLIQSAGVGVAEKLCGFIMLVPSAFSQSMSAFVGQNIGAGQPQRARKALFYGIGASLCAGVVMFYMTFAHGAALSALFARDEAVILAAADYLRAYGLDCLLTSFLFCFSGYFSGRGKTVFVMLQGVIGAFLVRIPVSFLVSRIPGVSLFAIGLATPASTLVQIILCGAYFMREMRQERAELGAKA
ncbi:MAG: MATE family efflux transporter [Clostridia bacterium]|nr:MATE family efflux transporter [Clostridia bacterium]